MRGNAVLCVRVHARAHARWRGVELVSQAKAINQCVVVVDDGYDNDDDDDDDDDNYDDDKYDNYAARRRRRL